MNSVRHRDGERADAGQPFGPLALARARASSASAAAAIQCRRTTLRFRAGLRNDERASKMARSTRLEIFSRTP